MIYVFINLICASNIINQYLKIGRNAVVRFVIDVFV